MIENVHYLPNQPMSLLSVDKLIAHSNASSPDFKKLEWTVGDSTLRMNKSNGTYALSAHAAPSAQY